MKYKFELVAKTENYSIIDENNEEYRLEINYYKNMDWEGVEVYNGELDICITESDIGKEIIEQFKHRMDI